MARSESGWRRLGCRALACSRRTSVPRLCAGPGAAHCGASVRKLDHSDAGGFPGETGARVQLYPQRAPGWVAAAAACPAPGSPLPAGVPGSLLREARGPREGRFPFRFASGSWDRRIHRGRQGARTSTKTNPP